MLLDLAYGTAVTSLRTMRGLARIAGAISRWATVHRTGQLRLARLELRSERRQVHLRLLQLRKQLPLLLFHVMRDIFTEHLDLGVEELIGGIRGFDLAHQILHAGMLYSGFIHEARILLLQRTARG